MPLVSDSQLAALRKYGNQGLTGSAHILRSTQTATDFGSQDVWATVALDVPCWIRGTAIPDDVYQPGFRLTTITTYRCLFEVDVDVEPDDRLIIAGEQYEVIETNVENTIKIFKIAMAKVVA